MMVRQTLRAAEIPFLRDEEAVYTCDFRAIGESMQYSIPAMWKYENLMPWVLQGQTVVVNPDSRKLNFQTINKFIEIGKEEDPKVSVYKRLDDVALDQKITKLWVAIPNPEADTFAKNKGYKINYSHEDFQHRNDKFFQKKCLEGSSPNWEVIDSGKHLQRLIARRPKYFIKRRHGSGGYTIFIAQEAQNSQKFQELFSAAPQDWYFEERVDGHSYSVQCLKFANADKVTCFGYSEQIIDQGRYFSGSRLLRLENLSDHVFAQLSDALEKAQPLLTGYEGFFGIDFIIDDGRVCVLELNVRLTAATVPTLLANVRPHVAGTYLEDVKQSDLNGDSVILGHDDTANLVDAIQFFAHD